VPNSVQGDAGAEPVGGAQWVNINPAQEAFLVSRGALI